jgi:primary-amine oxidase
MLLEFSALLVAGSFAWLCSASLIGGEPPLGYERQVLRRQFNTRTTSNYTPPCLQEGTPKIKAPKTNPWAPISPEDNLAVWNLLHDPATGLNLTESVL